MFIYYIDGERYINEDFTEIPLNDISSPNENTPALEELKTGEKIWCKKGWVWFRLTGPAIIRSDGREEFCLNEIRYKNVREWIKDHPNPDLYFHKIGVFTETDKVLWYLQN